MRKSDSKLCPLTLAGNCKFEQTLVSSAIKKPVVFYAYDSLSEDNPHYFKQKSLRQSLESKVKEYGFEFKAFDNTTSNGLDWFCNKVCFDIQNSTLVIADVSTYDSSAKKYTINPNVSFELGMAFGFRVNYLLITSTPESSLPADFKNLEIIKYEEDFINGKLDRYLNLFLKIERTSSGFELIAGRNNWGGKIYQAELINSDWFLAAEFHSIHFRSRRYIDKVLKHREEKYNEKNEYIIKRLDNFHELLNKNDNNRFYHIFEIGGLKEYFSTGYSRLNNTKQALKVDREYLIEEIDSTIELFVKHYPRLMIAFYEGKLPYAFFVRPENCVIIDSKSEFPDTLNGISATLKGIVDEMTKVFWKHWEEIPFENKQRDYVIEQYNELKKLIK